MFVKYNYYVPVADRCQFKHNGTPTTEPGTPDDAKRIQLSQWITNMLVEAGDEQPGEYHTPGTGLVPRELRQQVAAIQQQLTEAAADLAACSTKLDQCSP